MVTSAFLFKAALQAGATAQDANAGHVLLDGLWRLLHLRPPNKASAGMLVPSFGSLLLFVCFNLCSEIFFIFFVAFTTDFPARFLANTPKGTVRGRYGGD